MAKRPPHADHDDGGDDIPELEDVVETPTEPGATPPPNLDLFGGAEMDFERLREELLDQLTGEIETVIAQVRADIEQILRLRLDAQLRDRLPDIVDQVLRDNGNGNGNDNGERRE